MLHLISVAGEKKRNYYSLPLYWIGISHSKDAGLTQCAIIVILKYVICSVLVVGKFRNFIGDVIRI